MVDVMKLVSFVSGKHLRRHPSQLRQSPAVDLFHLLNRHTVALGLEAVEISERKPRSIAQLSIAVSHALQDLVRTAHVVEIV